MSHPLLLRLPQINRNIDGETGVSFRVLLKLFPAPVTAEIVLFISVRAGEPGFIFIDGHQTNGVSCHFYLLWIITVFLVLSH